ncbi:N-acetylmuramoyl-L-alanine amidase [Jeotgalibacillus alimentarius]|uniref:N-acetylmuramoyl-L-alanine amidase n=1 Tax=Jeotgalibacillus alimentarius TaxID=135826 RepID=A0A0C2RXW7_9BACL|nr:N-acetylmuramoyl-L-alanine amidase [Jeotgalibacillus alimentarius]KIL46619.1 N-acetylmuramoyl-L-alanine amidase [Jeotgalibacillus alimentarius]
MRNVSRFLILIPALILVFSALSVGSVSKASSVFSDVDSDFWAKSEIEYLHSLGVISGYEENGSTLYKWNNKVTRAQAAKMLVVASGSVELNVSSATFDDVPTDHWASGWVERAVRLGIFTDGNDSFNPNANLSRAQMSKIIVEAFDLDFAAAAQEPVVFTDASQSEWAVAYINALYYNGISNGSNNLFKPLSDVDRAQFAAFMSRALNDEYKLAVEAPQPAPEPDPAPDPEPTPEPEPQPEPEPSPADPVIAKLVVKQDDLNVRSGPGTAHGILGTVDEGDRLNVYDLNGDWAKVDFNGKQAYVHQYYVTFLDTLGDALGSPTDTARVTDAYELNVRSGPSSSATVVGKIKNGTTVTLFGGTGDWVRVEHNGLPAFIHKGYITINVPTPEPATSLSGKATVASLNVRAGAGVSHPVVTVLNQGDRVDVISISGYWAEIKTSSGKVGFVNKTYLKLINNAGNILKDRIIVIDAGHGATDPGASVSGYTEKAINLEVARRVEAKLKSVGADVRMTRTSDVFPSLQDRVDFSYKNYGEIFVSIHANAIGSSSVSGAETFYDVQYNDNTTESYHLANEVQKEIVARAGMKNRGVKTEAFYVLRNQNIPSILVELGFMTNPSDLAKLTSSKYMEIYAEAVFRGIVDYYSLK